MCLCVRARPGCAHLNGCVGVGVGVCVCIGGGGGGAKYRLCELKYDNLLPQGDYI